MIMHGSPDSRRDFVRGARALAIFQKGMMTRNFYVIAAVALSTTADWSTSISRQAWSLI